MVSSSKILTVSYGTFSCTAEGFEDPLAVMKDTTQFFRSVVGEDRFFGAEPPQFDPELASELMREQIASHEGGKVSLDLAGTSVGTAAAASSGALAAALAAGPARVASPIEAQPLPDDDTIEATAYEPEIENAAEQAIDQDAETDASDMAELVEDTLETDDLDLDALLVEETDQAAALAEPVGNAPAPRPTGAASVAAKLDRIRAVVADTEANAELDTDVDDLIEESAQISDAVSEFDAEDAAADTFDDDSFTDDTLNALLSEHASDSIADAPLDQPQIEDDNLFADTIAGLMQADTEESATPEAVSSEPEPDVEQVLDAAFDEDEGEFDLVAALDQVDKAEAAESDGDPLAAWDVDADEDAFDETKDDILGGDIASAVAGLTDTAFDDEDDDSLFDDEPVDELTDAVSQTPEEAPEPVADAAVDVAPTPVSAPAPRRVRARVVKVKRAAFDQAVQSGQLEEVKDEVAQTPASSSAPKVVETPPAVPLASSSSLSDEEEDELARELAAVKAELAGWDDEHQPETPVESEPQTPPLADASQEDDWGWDDEDGDDLDNVATATSEPLRLDNPVSTPEPEIDLSAAIDGARKAVKLASPARAMLTEQSVEDNDTSRILDQTNTELEEPEGNRRRSAIAHLRAAVAATKADRLLGRKPTPEEETEPYREDLANVVRPRRPQAAGARTERPSVEAQRPAPLKLVAEQRIEDTAPEGETPAQVTPVRPRRVSRSVHPAASAPPRAERPQENAAPAPLEQPSSDSDFAAYAESVGATDLPELLEAAAAYMSYVEGLDQFSRPQLMTTVRQAELTESSREDRLRSFGQLLRDGKIEKTSGGRFTASERISFKPSRAAG
ncbi:MAG: hypothetical protein ACRBB0_24130 [Pelagimonas sp.]|uniref:hypothetical protein n=1 Tax=Pelagimonas sp. TaxID=2073170 RepID=UPI003D6C20C4